MAAFITAKRMPRKTLAISRNLPARPLTGAPWRCAMRPNAPSASILLRLRVQLKRRKRHRPAPPEHSLRSSPRLFPPAGHRRDGDPLEILNSPGKGRGDLLDARRSPLQHERGISMPDRSVGVCLPAEG